MIARIKSDPWRDFRCAFELPWEDSVIQSPLSSSLVACDVNGLALDNLLGAYPAVVHAKTWQALWRANDELIRSINKYEAHVIQRGSDAPDYIFALSNATKNWLDQVVRHLETIKKIHNVIFASHAPKKQKKGNIAAQLEPFWDPLSRCVNKLKHEVAEVCPIHYVSMESGVVTGFYIGISYGPTTFGPHPHVHPTRGAWSFNRLLPLVATGVFWADHLIDAAIRRGGETSPSSERYDAIQSLDEQSLRAISSRPLFVFPDERAIPFPRIKFLRRTVEFAASTLLPERPKFPLAARIESVLSLTSVYKGYTFELPYWQPRG